MTGPNISVDGGMEKNAFLIRVREPVIFPYTLGSLTVEKERDLAAVDGAMRGDRLLAVFNDVPTDREIEMVQIKGSFPHFADNSETPTCAVGTLVRIVKKLQLPDGSCRLAVRGLQRINGVRLFESDGKPMVCFRSMQESGIQDTVLLGARFRELQQMYTELMMMNRTFGDDDMLKFSDPVTPGRGGDLIADAVPFSYAEKLLLLVVSDVDKRLEILSVILNRELEQGRLGIRLQTQVQEAVGASQREFYLREQLKAIKNELGEFNGNTDVLELTEKLEKCTLPEQVAETVKKELERLELLPQNAPEYHISYNYISTMLDIPWLIYSEDQLDCKTASKILDADHFGLEDVKKRILEFLAVMQRRSLSGECRAPILCLVGPPGVGKTSIGRSIARAMKREFIRVSFGGVRDEAEIRGHRRTYIGAMPGRIVQNLKRAGTANPVFMLDEIDKLAHDFRGDPASALLEVLDPEQNNAFNDNFVELPLDLSKVFFIATANVLEDIPGPLRDRMEIIRLSGYTALEKKEIAKRYLIPRQLKENGVADSAISFKVSAVNEIIDGYTMEAGVRELDRVIAQVCRRSAMKFITGEWDENEKLSIDQSKVGELLGARKFLKDPAPEPEVGCATGMAWTSVGGVILPVETIAFPGGKGNLKLTGSLGRVMLESAEAAFSCVRRYAPETIKPEFFTEHDFHIHVPDGATPKDGPSAGITMTLALMSLLLKKPLIPRLAMTGEITLRGKVTAIGGVREKLVGALRAGIKEVIVPQENAKDVQELPENIKKALTIHFVSNFEEAMKIAFR